EALGVDPALRQGDDVFDVDVVEGDVEVGVALLGHESVHVDATIATIAQLEVLDVDAGLAPVESGGAGARPDAGVELQLQIVERQLVADLVQSERRVGSVGALVVLAADPLETPDGPGDG